MKTLLYPKKYCTITYRNRFGLMTLMDDSGNEYMTHVRARRGKGSTDKAQVGVRVKMFSRSGEIMWSFIGG